MLLFEGFGALPIFRRMQSISNGSPAAAVKSSDICPSHFWDPLGPTPWRPPAANILSKTHVRQPDMRSYHCFGPEVALGANRRWRHVEAPELKIKWFSVPQQKCCAPRNSEETG